GGSPAQPAHPGLHCHLCVIVLGSRQTAVLWCAVDGTTLLRQALHQNIKGNERFIFVNGASRAAGAIIIFLSHVVFLPLLVVVIRVVELFFTKFLGHRFGLWLKVGCAHCSRNRRGCHRRLATVSHFFIGLMNELRCPPVI